MDRVSAEYRLSMGRVSIEYQLSIGRLSIENRSSVDRVSAEIVTGVVGNGSVNRQASIGNVAEVYRLIIGTACSALIPTSSVAVYSLMPLSH